MVLFAIGMATLGGCSSGGTDADTEATGDDDDEERRVADEMVDWTFSPSRTSASSDTDPDVVFDNGEEEVVITGVYYHGNTCGEVAVDTVSYTNGELHVRLISEPKNGEEPQTPTPCGAAVRYEGYRLTVEFSDGIPANVVIEQNGDQIQTTPENQ